jgi:hypothetical protein
MTILAAGLPKSWPPAARGVLLDAARYYYREMSGPWPVSDVIMDRAIEQANREMASRQDEIYEEASDRWIDRWEGGDLDAEMRRAIQATFQRMRRAERPIRARLSSKKSRTQLDADIAQSLAERRR